jgi:hypothetical protein
MRRALSLLIVGLLCTAPLFADSVRAAGEAATADLDILRDTIRANRKGLVAVNLTLTDAEAAQFWPLYDRYQADVKAVNDRLVKVISDYTSQYSTMTDDKAQKLAEDYLAAEEDRAKVRRQYFPEFAKIVHGKKAARFYQIENKMDAVIRYDLAAYIPVVEQ